MFGHKETSAAPTVTVQDGVIAGAWGLTDWQWSTLTDSARADYRDRVVYAPNFATAGV